MTREQPGTWRLLTSGFSNAFENMAVDEAVFKACARKIAPPTIRFYGWDPPAVSIGCLQKTETAVDLQACKDLGIDFVRRISGGRAVLHDQELTYSIVASEGNPLFPENVLGTYKVIAQCLVDTLRALDIDAQLVTNRKKVREPAGALRRKSRGSCFSALSWYEISVDGKKICGNAQRRSRGAFLQHGFILLGYDVEKISRVFKGEDQDSGAAIHYDDITHINKYLDDKIDFYKLQTLLIESFERVLNIKLETGLLTGEEIAIKEKLLHDRFLHNDWNLLKHRRKG